MVCEVELQEVSCNRMASENSNIQCKIGSGIIRAELAKKILLEIVLSLLLLLCGCSTPTEILPVEMTATLEPYSMSSLTPTNTLTSATITAVPTVGPTATPFVHVVQKEETLLGIAIRYGVSLDELLAANPGINPTILSINQEIIIPGPEGDSASNFVPEATPLPVPFSEVECFPTATDQLWCIASLENQDAIPLEGVSASIMLFNDVGEVVDSRSAFSPLGLIPEGGIIPLAVLFPFPSDEYSYAMILPISAYEAENIEERYLPLEWTLEKDEPGEGQKTWYVSGTLISSDERERLTQRVSILGVALDDAGRIVGFRQLELESQLKSGEKLPFELEIFSLGPIIDHVEILAEARVSIGVE